MQTELFVELVMSDTEALTTLQTMQSMGYSDVKKVIKRDYYSAESATYLYDELSSNDLLVNVNKHTCEKLHKLPNDGLSYFCVLIKNKYKSSLQEVLMKRFGLPITQLVQGTLWIIGFSSRESASKQGRTITKQLLYNKHFQEVQYW